MKKVTPKVFLLAQQEGIPQAPMKTDLHMWLQHMDGSEVLEHLEGAPGEQLVELAAKRCYKSFKPGLNLNVTKVRQDSVAFHRNIIKTGHGSVMEHAVATFAFENVSRVFTHELVRHRVGTAFSQESLRYVRLDELHFWIPPEIAENKEALEIFESTIRWAEGAQRKLAEIFDIDNLPMEKKKQLTSAFRRIAPIGLATGIVVTFNMRALRHIIEMRTNKAAEIEARLVFNMVAQMAQHQWPMFFQDMTCHEVDSNEDGSSNGPPVWEFEHSKV